MAILVEVQLSEENVSVVRHEDDAASRLSYMSCSQNKGRTMRVATDRAVYRRVTSVTLHFPAATTYDTALPQPLSYSNGWS